jgi:hypothetical protein
VRRKGWTPIGAVEVGDYLRTPDGSWVAVNDVFDNDDVEPVYNLHVGELHTYFVGRHMPVQIP